MTYSTSCILILKYVDDWSDNAPLKFKMWTTCHYQTKSHNIGFNFHTILYHDYTYDIAIFLNYTASEIFC